MPCRVYIGLTGRVSGQSQRSTAVRLDGHLAYVHLLADKLHVLEQPLGCNTNDHVQPSALLSNWPRPTLNRQPVKKTALRQFLKQYGEDPQFRTDLQMLEPRSDLALSFALGERAPEEASSMFVGCLTGCPVAFNVTDQHSTAAAGAAKRAAIADKVCIKPQLLYDVTKLHHLERAQEICASFQAGCWLSWLTQSNATECKQ